MLRGYVLTGQALDKTLRAAYDTTGSLGELCQVGCKSFHSAAARKNVRCSSAAASCSRQSLSVDCPAHAMENFVISEAGDGKKATSCGKRQRLPGAPRGVGSRGHARGRNSGPKSLAVRALSQAALACSMLEQALTEHQLIIFSFQKIQRRPHSSARWGRYPRSAGINAHEALSYWLLVHHVTPRRERSE